MKDDLLKASHDVIDELMSRLPSDYDSDRVHTRASFMKAELKRLGYANVSNEFGGNRYAQLSIYCNKDTAQEKILELMNDRLSDDTIITEIRLYGSISLEDKEKQLLSEHL
jgi:hypothetical protein